LDLADMLVQAMDTDLLAQHNQATVEKSFGFC
jgi:hypothetical protein